MTDKPRFALTCWWCRLGHHEECCPLIVIGDGPLAGQHKCACEYPRHPKSIRAECHKQSDTVKRGQVIQVDRPQDTEAGVGSS